MVLAVMVKLVVMQALEAGTDPDRQGSCMAIAQPVFGLNNDFKVKH